MPKEEAGGTWPAEIQVPPLGVASAATAGVRAARREQCGWHPVCWMLPTSSSSVITIAAVRE